MKENTTQHVATNLPLFVKRNIEYHDCTERLSKKAVHMDVMFMGGALTRDVDPGTTYKAMMSLSSPVAYSAHCWV